MNRLGQSWQLLEQLRAEMEYCGEDFEVFGPAPEIPSHLQAALTEEACPCWGCVILRSSRGLGAN
jgi:hypothetical protein